jgi:capsular polysaccharide transport system ATP-binding protein
MIVLHSVTKELGRGHRKKVVLDNIDLVIPLRAQLVILGQVGSGKSTLLNVISGIVYPTSGWVERRATISTMMKPQQYGGNLSPRRVVDRLAIVYGVDGPKLLEFVVNFAELQNLVDVPQGNLPPRIRQRLTLALFYGLPCDFYLFDGSLNKRNRDLKDKVEAAFLRRRESAGMILATASIPAAREFGGTGAVLFNGKLTLFESLDQAIELYKRLMVEYPAQRTEVEVEVV